MPRSRSSTLESMTRSTTLRCRERFRSGAALHPPASSFRGRHARRSRHCAGVDWQHSGGVWTWKATPSIRDTAPLGNDLSDERRFVTNGEQTNGGAGRRTGAYDARGTTDGARRTGHDERGTTFNGERRTQGATNGGRRTGHNERGMTNGRRTGPDERGATNGERRTGHDEWGATNGERRTGRRTGHNERGMTNGA